MFDNGHVTVIGRTQVGKTYTTNRLLKRQPQGVIFFNTQYENLPGYTTVNADNCTWKQIISLLNKGKKLNYMPGSYPEQKDSELSYIIDKLYLSGFSKDNYVILAVDEVHLYTEKKVQAELRRVATGGIRFGIHGVFISQRPALIDNTLMTQSVGMIIFHCNMESQYFKRYGIPYEDMEKQLDSLGQYSYCEYDFKNIVCRKGI